MRTEGRHVGAAAVISAMDAIATLARLRGAVVTLRAARTRPGHAYKLGAC